MSRNALRRAGAVADGWLGQYAIETLSERDVKAAVEVMTSEAEAAGRDGGRPRVVIRITGAADKPDAVAARLDNLAKAGATEVVVDVDWGGDGGGPARAHRALSAGLN
jgi:alkanesulfonate monooxygenase SsuD/methylene tetrahydromethanopterin reductase-like flavin-dependent oxidoreductase (luciferase family)